MDRRLYLLIVLLTFHFMAIARQTGDAKPAVSKGKTALLARLALTKPDTGRVNALFALADLHWRKEYSLDSIISYCSRAMTLAKQLKYEEGLNESANLLCIAYTKQKEFDKARSLLSQVSKEQQARLLLRIGEEFLFQPNLKKPILDTAFRYFNQALQLAQSIGSVTWKHESLIALGKYYYASGQLQKGKESFLVIIRDLQQARDVVQEAHIWNEMGKYMPDTDSSFQDQLWAHNNSLRLYHQLKDTGNLYSVMEDIAAVNMFHSRFDTARAQFLQAMQWRKEIGRTNMLSCTRALGWIAYATGNLEEALQWALATEKNLQELEKRAVSSDQALLGLIYAEDGQYEKALSYLLDAKSGHAYFRFLIPRKVTEQYIRLGQPEKALAWLKEFEAKDPPENPNHQESIAAAKGDIYAALNKPALAGQYYREMIALDGKAQQFKAREIYGMPFDVSGPEAYYKMARYYVEQRQYAEAAPYLATAARFKAFSGYQYYPATLRRDMRQLQYKVDSAAGNYQAALEHHLQYTLLNDSISNAVKIRQFHQLQVQNETEKKELVISQKDTLIRSMQQTAHLRQANLRQANLIRNISIIATLILLVLGALLYRQNRQKQRASQLVTIQNIQLQHLLKEKEWLLKEVHHRVKNNLHTIISLLESQAVFLENDALKAIESSQHRIYAMSLIHQKLYQVDNVKTIEMSQYLPEFIQYLKQSFGNTNKIVFQTEIEPMSLDVAVAIPVALILNEAVTNSIKYAFPGNRKGTIRVAMYHEAGETVLEIADDGIGIDENIKDQTLNSLGVELMKGLSEDINGRIEFASTAGTKITVRFSADPLFYPTLQPEKEMEVPV
ncbi:hypothetical protein D3H65_10050 [Paraflavitalea soli]|uniref:histidine kinase n=1 Tax=Paraflavitalea soli TaxID=2315862 RepID=A0A3B7MMZ2_9BACT|nr:histidine kinase dimerization/phosphoacceptor domain -containing protein [Paraflavitalea soli]AXY74296.1 hypothetical protein D3H65_10050 [Paraflavitalea soli]